MPPKRFSAADMLSKARHDEAAGESGDASQQRPPVPTRSQDVAATSELVAVTPGVTYERATVYLRPDQRAWLEEVLDTQVRDASGKRIKSISVSDIIRLAIDRLQGAVQEEAFPLLPELIDQANKDAETFSGRKNRGIPKR